jgi:hypothetical protein
VLAEYALEGYRQPLGVSNYQIGKAIPEELRSSLPEIDELENELADDRVFELRLCSD